MYTLIALPFIAAYMSAESLSLSTAFMLAPLSTSIWAIFSNPIND